MVFYKEGLENQEYVSKSGWLKWLAKAKVWIRERGVGEREEGTN